MSRLRSQGAGSDVITVDQHRAAILAAVRPLPHVELSVADALGRTLAVSARAAVDLPLFDNSAMDGFAVRFVDVATASPSAPVVLRVVADLPAGTAADPGLGEGDAARIMTGAPLPGSADTVVPFEDTLGGLGDSLVTAAVTRAPRRPGAHVRRRGEDCVIDAEIVAAGSELGALQLSAIAAANVSAVTVSARPKVAVIATGAELVAPGTSIGAGQIPESNSVLLASLARDAGADVVQRITVSDVDDDLRRAILAAGDVDLIVTSGGISAGAYEVVRTALPHLSFVQVAMQPGRPQAFSPGPPLVVSLPGNPVSAAVSFEVFARPALLAMQGRSRVDRRSLRLPAAAAWRSPHGRRQFVPIVLNDGGVAPAATVGSHRAAGNARADGYAVIPEHIDAVAVGDTVDVLLLS